MPSARAVPRALRAHPGVAALWGVALAAAVALAVFAALNDRLPGDLSATRTVQDWPFPGQPFADILRFLSGTEFVVTIGAVLAVTAWLSGRRRPALALAAGLAVMVLLQFGVKEIVDRPRPSPDLVDLRAGFTSPSFPSGHTMSPSYLYGFLATAAFVLPVTARVRAAVAGVVVAFLMLGGLANVWLGVHWTSDVVGGYLWAAAVIVPTALDRLPQPSVTLPRVHSALVEIDVALRAAAAIAGAAALGQIISRRFPIPLPLFLLAAGLLLGRDGLNIVRSHELEDLIRIVVVLAVALIVFEGGTALRLASLRTLAPVVRNIIVLGLLVTPTVGAFVAWVFLDFDWRMAFLFGALVSVTGPSVLTPLLRSIRVDDRLRDILASEGVIIDPFGALLTLFLLEIVLAETLNVAGPTWWVIERLLIGLAVGAGGAFLVWLLSRTVKRLGGREMALFVIGAAVAAFAVAESLAHESGLVAMVLMAIAIGNLRLPQRERVDDLQESVTVWLIASVYVLLAAGISIDDLTGLWPEGLIVVAILALIGRPLLIVLASIRSGLNWREQAFLSAVAPRGVVAASLAGVVAVEASSLAGSDASRLVAMVFVVILLTIGIQSAYAGALARLLRVQPMTTVVAGAGEVGRRVATLIAGSGEPVLVVETDEDAVMQAREEGLEVLIGDISDTAVLEKIRLNEAKALLLATPDDARNLLAAQLARSKFNCESVFVRVNDVANIEAFQRLGVVPVSQSEAVASELARMVAGPMFQDVLAQVAEDVTVARVVVTSASAQREIQAIPELRGTLVVLVTRGSDSVIPNGRTELRLGDIVTIFGSLQDLAIARGGLSVVPEPEPIIS